MRLAGGEPVPEHVGHLLRGNQGLGAAGHHRQQLEAVAVAVSVLGVGHPVLDWHSYLIN